MRLTHTDVAKYSSELASAGSTWTEPNRINLNNSTQITNQALVIGQVHGPARQRQDLLRTDWLQTLQRTRSFSSEHVYSNGTVHVEVFT